MEPARTTATHARGGPLNLQTLPKDLLQLILFRLSVEEIRQLCSVSLRILLVARDPYFQKRYLSHNSESHDSVLFASKKTSIGWDFTSTRTLQPNSTSFLCFSDCPTSRMEYAEGLLCSGLGEVTTILNPTSGNCIVLPRFPESCGKEVKTYIGFNPCMSNFKVLGMLCSSRDRATNHQLLSIELDKKSSSWEWKPVACSIPHIVFPKSLAEHTCISIGEVLYYVAYLSKHQVTMIQFHMGTETFVSNPIPQPSAFGVFVCSAGLLDISGKVGVCFLQLDGRYNLWTLEDSKKNTWSLMVVEVPVSIQNQLKSFPPAEFEGLTRWGDIVFSQPEGSVLCLYFFNPTTNETQRIQITRAAASFQKKTFWNHVNSLMFI